MGLSNFIDVRIEGEMEGGMEGDFNPNCNLQLGFKPTHIRQVSVMIPECQIKTQKKWVCELVVIRVWAITHLHNLLLTTKKSEMEPQMTNYIKGQLVSFWFVALGTILTSFWQINVCQAFSNGPAPLGLTKFTL